MAAGPQRQRRDAADLQDRRDHMHVQGGLCRAVAAGGGGVTREQWRHQREADEQQADEAAPDLWADGQQHGERQDG